MIYYLDYERLSHHKSMISDRQRTGLYKSAIEKVVKHGDIIVDIGTGLGILSFFASKLGVERLYAIERTYIIQLAKQIANKNKIKIIFIKDDSSNVILPEKVDVIVSECIGYFALQENMIKDVINFRKRFLNKGGKVIPKKIELFISPVQNQNAYENISFWKKIYNINFSPAKKVAVNTTYHIDFELNDLLAEPKIIKTINLEKDENIDLNASVKFRINKNGILHGLCGYFRAQLTDDIILNTGPGLKTHWRCEYFPIEKTAKVKVGDVVSAKIKSILHKGFTDWEWEVYVNSIKEKHSTIFGCRLKEANRWKKGA